MSNYPPGVTGNERQIAGPRAIQTTRKCDAKDIRRATMSWEAEGALQTLRGSLGRMTNVIAQARNHDRTNPDFDKLLELMTELAGNHYAILNASLRGAQFFSMDECPFDGEIEVEYEHGYFYWECPVCGKEHEEEDTSYQDYHDERADAIRKGEDA